MMIRWENTEYDPYALVVRDVFGAYGLKAGVSGYYSIESHVKVAMGGANTTDAHVYKLPINTPPAPAAFTGTRLVSSQYSIPSSTFNGTMAVLDQFIFLNAGEVLVLYIGQGGGAGTSQFDASSSTTGKFSLRLQQKSEKPGSFPY